MAPTGSRKRVKTSPPTPGDGATSLSPAGRERSSSQKQGNGANWYPGVWPVSRSSKAAPVTEVARESISVAQNVASDTTTSLASQLDSPKQPRNPSLQLTRKAGASSRSLPAGATTTRINIASDGSASTPAAESDPGVSPSEPATQESANDKGVDVGNETGTGHSNNTTKVSNLGAACEGVESSQVSAAPTQSSGWLSWFYGPSTTEDTTVNSMTKSSTVPPNEDQSSKEDNVSQPDPEPTNQSEPPENKPPEIESPENNPPEVSEIPGNSQKRSWFQMWYGSDPPAKSAEAPTREPLPTENEESTPSITLTPPTSNQNPDKPAEADESAGVSAKDGKSSGWSFWFRDASQDPTQEQPQGAESNDASIHQDPSLRKPQDGSEMETDQKIEIATKGSVKIKPPKSGSEVPNKIVPGPESEPNVPTQSLPEAAASKHLQRILPNQVLPRFKDTFALQERPTILQTIGRFLHYNKEADNKHVHMTRDLPQIKNALAIGIHGYFPAPLIRSVLGQPTGTSIRFSNMAADAIRNWVDDHGYTCNIEKIALEGEGRISERVDLLWKLLLNWMEEIRKADFILVACHSQGVPVAMMLVAKLISFGCLNAARVGVCAMAGVNLGPFSDYRSRWISGSAGELFEFALPYSQVSKDYEAALKSSLDFGVRISYIGSIDDQLVSLESSLFSPVTHPYIYRAVFVDGRVHAPSFVSHLVGFALKLRNLGIPDHGLIRELSSPLAGSLYSGEGHSRLYDDETVYRLAIEFALETSSVQGATFNIRRNQPSSPVNPYILPFAMRGLLEEEYVRRELYDETMELLKQFDEWKPTSKVLKDVKFRLEGIRSKL